MSVADMVKEFHEKFGAYVAPKPQLPDFDLYMMRFNLIEEEVGELDEAYAHGDLIAIADALADITYVVYGAALAFGIPLDEVLAEVHRSNMSKLGQDGKPVLREDGKVLKGAGYSPPDIFPILERAKYPTP